MPRCCIESMRTKPVRAEVSKPLPSDRATFMHSTTPFGLSLSKARLDGGKAAGHRHQRREDFDKLSPNGNVPRTKAHAVAQHRLRYLSLNGRCLHRLCMGTCQTEWRP